LNIIQELFFFLRYPIYKSSLNYHLYFNDQVWEIAYPSIGVMAQMNGNGHQIYPESGKDWIFMKLNGDYEVYKNVPIKCTGKLILKFLFQQVSKK
jgi:hypothetical protein